MQSGILLEWVNALMTHGIAHLLQEAQPTTIAIRQAIYHQELIMHGYFYPVSPQAHMILQVKEYANLSLPPPPPPFPVLIMKAAVLVMLVRHILADGMDRLARAVQAPVLVLLVVLLHGIGLTVLLINVPNPCVVNIEPVARVMLIISVLGQMTDCATFAQTGIAKIPVQSVLVNGFHT